VIEVVPGTDFVLLKIAFVTSDEEFEKATTANMDVKVVGQPEAARVEKDSAVHFTGTLTSYDPEPAFFLHWEKAKVKEEDIPKDKGAPKKPVRKPAARKPGQNRANLLHFRGIQESGSSAIPGAVFVSASDFEIAQRVYRR